MKKSESKKKLGAIIEDLRNLISRAPEKSTGREAGKVFFISLLEAIIDDSKRWKELDQSLRKKLDGSRFRFMSDYNDFMESELGEAILDYYENAVKTGKFDEIVD